MFCAFAYHFLHYKFAYLPSVSCQLATMRHMQVECTHCLFHLFACFMSTKCIQKRLQNIFFLSKCLGWTEWIKGTFSYPFLVLQKLILAYSYAGTWFCVWALFHWLFDCLFAPDVNHVVVLNIIVQCSNGLFLLSWCQNIINSQS